MTQRLYFHVPEKAWEWREKKKVNEGSKLLYFRGIKK